MKFVIDSSTEIEWPINDLEDLQDLTLPLIGSKVAVIEPVDIMELERRMKLPRNKENPAETAMRQIARLLCPGNAFRTAALNSLPGDLRAPALEAIMSGFWKFPIDSNTSHEIGRWLVAHESDGGPRHFVLSPGLDGRSATIALTEPLIGWAREIARGAETVAKDFEE